MRRIVLLFLVMAMVLVALPAAAAPQFPDEIDLPGGFFPEGIAVGKGSSFYVGSLSTGSIYKGDLRTGEGNVLVTGTAPFTTVGIEVDNRERIWVAGGPSGTGRVYDGNTGALLAAYAFTDPEQSFVNDVVVTKDAAYFTDSGTRNDPIPGAFWFAGEPRLFVVPLTPGGGLPDASDVEMVPVDVPDITFPNLNGIETTPGGNSLIVAHTSGQMLFAVDPATGDAEVVDVGGFSFLGADGLIRRGTTVYVVENGDNRVTAVRISPDGSSGMITDTYTQVGVETPTTAGLFGSALYVVDARFGTGAGPYKVFRVELN
jgi:sugar lactone lactonase YvrE